MREWQVSIHWDNGDENVYRYGAEYCYDVVECVLWHTVKGRVNPMEKESFVPLGGSESCAESDCDGMD